MAKTVANVAIATDTFAGWVGKTNVLLDALTYEIVTCDNTTGGANTSGNGNVIGILTANTLGTNLLKGGGVGNTANISSLTIGISNSTTSSNVTLTGYAANIVSNSLFISSNTTIGTGTQGLIINVSDVVVNAATLDITLTNDLVVNTDLKVTGNVEANSALTFTNKVQVFTKSISLTFPDTATQNLVDSFAIADFVGAKYTVNVTDVNNSNNKAMTELSIVYGFSNAHMTEYGTIYSNTQFATFSINATATHVRLYANSATSAALFKVHRVSFI